MRPARVGVLQYEVVLSRSRLVPYLVFGFFLFLGISWSSGQPPYGISDEPAHAVKALATARGELDGASVVGPFGYQAIEYKVPSAYSEIWHFVCYNSDVNAPANCAPKFPTSRVLAPVPSTAGEYPPTYYALVGWAGWISPGSTGLLLMRIVTSIGVATLLGLSARVLEQLQWPHGVTALIVATTPVVMGFTGSVNPFGPEIAASILFWTSSLALQSVELINRRVARLGVWISGLLLGTLRPAAFLWIAIIVIVVALWRFDSGVRSISPRIGPYDRAFLLSSITGFALSLGWYLFAMTARGLGGGSPAGGTTWGNMRISFDRTIGYLHQTLGYFGWTSFYSPRTVVLLMVAALGVLLWSARKSTWRVRVGILALILYGVFGPAILEGARAATAGFGFQGRYLLPVLVGLPILCSRGADDESVRPSTVRFLRGVAILGHLIALNYVLRRFSVGLDGTYLWLFDPTWAGMPGKWILYGSILGTLACGLGLISATATGARKHEVRCSQRLSNPSR